MDGNDVICHRYAGVNPVNGPSTVRDQFTTAVHRIEPLPPLLADVDTLVVTTALAFDYPGENLYDRFGQLSRSPG
jgi:hypothetical protein